MRRSVVVAAGVVWMSSSALAVPPVAIDVGHYLARSGATSAYGVPEFEYNHSLAAVIAARLAADGVPVRLIGQRGEMAELQARPQQAEEAGAGFFLSIHHDSVQETHLQPWVWNGRALRYADDFAGFSLFVSRLNPRLPESLACASAIGAALRNAGLKAATHHAGREEEGRAWADEANGVYFYDNLVVLKRATMPAVLLEAGVIVNRAEERQLASAERRELTAAAVEAGLQSCGVAPAGVNQSARAGSETR